MAKGTKSGSIGSMGKGGGRHFGSAISTVKEAPKGDYPPDVFFTDPAWNKTVPNSITEYSLKGKYTASLEYSADIGVSIGVNPSPVTLDTEALTWEADNPLPLIVGDNEAVVIDDHGISNSMIITREAA